MSGFEDGVDAAVGSGSAGKYGFWFFRGDRAVKTDKDGNTIAKHVADITVEWPAFKDSIFAAGVDAALYSGSGFWFFKGNQTGRTDLDGLHFAKGPGNITDPGNWPALSGTIFADGVDAAVESGDSGKWGFWFFKGNQAVKTDKDGNTIEKHVADITVEWPAFKDSIFASGVDEALYSGSGFWFFKGNQTGRTDLDGLHFTRGPGNITDPGNWPALRGI
ncbi:MAG: hypothetical protein ACRDRW_10015 [Pseudonocardiaceae bacterium]